MIDRLRPSWVRKIDVTRVEGCPVPGECWLWRGSHNDSGHGRVCIPNQARTGYIHRIVYELLIGPIPAGLQLDHLCRQPSCCSPRHLEPVACITNVQRGTRATKSHCVRGHPLSGKNVHIYLSKRGTHRVCRQCRHDYMREYRATRAAQRASTWAKYLGTEQAA